MKILCIIDSLGAGGAQRQLVELAKGFKASGHEVSFLTYYESNFFKPELDINNIVVRTIFEPNYLRRIFKIRKAIRNHKPDAVLSFLEAANFMATIAGFPSRKWKLVVGERNANPAIVTNKKLRFYRYAHFFADYIVGNSYKNIELVKMIVPRLKDRKIKVIYNIVDLSLKDYKYDQKEVTHIVVAARYAQQKNLEGLIDAVNLIPNEFKSKLLINWYGDISEGYPYYQICMSKIKELGLDRIIILNDKTNQILKKYQEADFVGLFSHFEGLPNAVCEAMAQGRAIIATRVSDIPLLIKDDINGFLCDSEDIESIKDAIVRALMSSEEERLRMIWNNFQIAKKEFDKKVVINEYLKILTNEPGNS